MQFQLVLKKLAGPGAPWKMHFPLWEVNTCLIKRAGAESGNTAGLEKTGGQVPAGGQFLLDLLLYVHFQAQVWRLPLPPV